MQAGDVVKFGRYLQGALSSVRPVTWTVLEVRGRRALLLSQWGLASRPYHPDPVPTGWDRCALRAWLNRDFLAAAFTPAEQQALLTTQVPNGPAQGHPGWFAAAGPDTADKVFLLSVREAERCLQVTMSSSHNARARVTPTGPAFRQDGAFMDRTKTGPLGVAGWWWLRSPGLSGTQAACVGTDGALIRRPVNTPGGCVRPAVWVDLDAAGL